MIRSKGQVGMGHEDPCEAPPIILKMSTITQIRNLKLVI